MSLSVLYIGGTGQISLPCVEASVGPRPKVTLLNRGRTTVPLPAGVETLVGDMGARPTATLADRSFDVVAQFRLFTPEEMARDIATFTGRTGQYVFISSASVYEKPVQHYLMTERTPQINPFWEYSRQQDRLREAAPRPERAPLHHRPPEPHRAHGHADPGRRCRQCPPPDARRQAGDRRRRRLVALDADAIRRSGPRLRRAPRQPQALGEDFQITTDRGFTWNQIHDAIASGLGVEAIHAHVPTATLVACNKAWEGPLMGDKSWSALFDNSKIKSVVGSPPLACLTVTYG